jgi:hypothetical protein
MGRNFAKEAVELIGEFERKGYDLSELNLNELNYP